MNTPTLKEEFCSGFKTRERWREGRGLSWLLRGGKKEEYHQQPFSMSPSVLPLHCLSDMVLRTTTAMAKSIYWSTLGTFSFRAQQVLSFTSTLWNPQIRLLACLVQDWLVVYPTNRVGEGVLLEFTVDCMCVHSLKCSSFFWVMRRSYSLSPFASLFVIHSHSICILQIFHHFPIQIFC